MRDVWKLVCLVTSLSVLALAVAGCSNGNNSSPFVGSTNATLLGTVQSLGTQSAVSGAKVTINGQQVTANENGWFVVPDLPPTDRALVKIEAPGEVPTQRVIALRKGSQTFLDAKMFDMAPAQDVDPAAGGEVDTGNAKVVIPAGAITTMTGGTPTGMAKVSLTVIDPTSTEQRQATPGDFTGLPAGSTTPMSISSFGMAYVSVKDANGNDLTFAPSMAATLSIPVPSGYAGTPPTQMPLWNYDQTSGRWVQQGMANYDGGTGTYTATIDQPAYWNADQTYDTACVSGQIVSPDGTPAPGGIAVVAEGTNYIGEADAWTDDQGRFQVQVMASTGASTATAQIYAQGGGQYTASPFQVNPTPTALASTGACTDIGTIQLAYPLATISLTWGAMPPDLDTELTGPDPVNGGRFLLDYSNMDVVDNSGADIVALDTDDTSSYGPEVTSLIQALPGTYVYTVHNYSGESSGPILQSMATVTAVFPGQTQIFHVEDATGTPTTDDSAWRVFEFTIDGSGNIGPLQPLNQIVDVNQTDPMITYDP